MAYAIEQEGCRAPRSGAGHVPDGDVAWRSQNRLQTRHLKSLRFRRMASFCQNAASSDAAAPGCVSRGSKCRHQTNIRIELMRRMLKESDLLVRGALALREFDDEVRVFGATLLCPRRAAASRPSRAARQAEAAEPRKLERRPAQIEAEHAAEKIELDALDPADGQAEIAAEREEGAGA